MANMVPQVSGGVKIMAAIGHVCVQWARLEMAILSVIFAVEGVPTAKGEMIYGGLDILPRINMSIKLAEYHKLPQPLQQRLRAVRKALQDGIVDRRNQVVHGAHKDMENDATTLTMVRWRGEKRDKVFTALDITNLGVEIYDLANECWSIRDDFGTWKFGPHRGEDSARDLPESGPVPRLKFTQRLCASLKHFWR